MSIHSPYIFDDDRLKAHVPVLIDQTEHRLASIAIVIAKRGDSDSVLFIQRAISKKDPWSGQIACPGGGWESQDSSLMDTAIRETYEEVGLVLRPSQLLCRLNDQQGRSNNQSLPLSISAFVFRIDSQQVEETPLTPNYEVASEFWIPVRWLVDDARAVAYLTPFRSEPYDAIQLMSIDSNETAASVVEYGNDRILWGLTYRFVQQLLMI